MPDTLQRCSGLPEAEMEVEGHTWLPVRSRKLLMSLFAQRAGGKRGGAKGEVRTAAALVMPNDCLSNT